jgi:hypothetical protein
MTTTQLTTAVEYDAAIAQLTAAAEAYYPRDDTPVSRSPTVDTTTSWTPSAPTRRSTPKRTGN